MSSLSDTFASDGSAVRRSVRPDHDAIISVRVDQVKEVFLPAF